jgi:hypothetical protein
MRINLSCPFAEKDQAKALGAKWDAAKRVWYIVDVENLTPFMRWMPSSKPREGVVSEFGSQSTLSRLQRP